MARPPLPPAPPKQRFYEEEMPSAPLPTRAQPPYPLEKKSFFHKRKPEPIHEEIFRQVVAKPAPPVERDIFAPVKKAPQEEEYVAPVRKSVPERTFKRPEREEQIANLMGMPTNKGPPLFIKIDKYREVVNSLQHLKTYALNLRDALDALQDMEKELANGIAITHHALDKFNATISALDSKITRIPSTDHGGDRELEELDTMARDMTEQVDRIRDELKSIRSQQ